MNLKNELEIILITHNRRKELELTLKQILADDSPIRHLDITILDNCSTDGTSEMIDKYSRDYFNITHIINKRNIGGNGNIARALEISSKKYLWILCDDDTYDWSCWSQIEQAIKEEYDVIFTRKVNKDLADIYYIGTFVPACIYKTENITNDAMFNAIENIHNMFPHLAILAKNINEDKKFFLSDSNIVNVGISSYGASSYIRGFEQNYIPPTRKMRFWAVGYLNSVELVKDRKKRIKIISGLRHSHASLFSFFKAKIINNKAYYNDYFYNYYQMFRHLSFMQKIIFFAAFFTASLKFHFANRTFLYLNGKEKWTKYFNFVNEQEYINRLARKYKNKKILLYGAGTLSESLFENYDLSKLNIVAVCDKKFGNKTKYRKQFAHNTVCS